MFYVKEAERSFKYTDHFTDWSFCSACNLCMSGLKAEALCPDSLALIGVYGSVITGDEYEKSDLDLMILINDENGQVLAYGFMTEIFVLTDECLQVPKKKILPSAENLHGTYEEMYSNWKNKMTEISEDLQDFRTARRNCDGGIHK